MNYNPSNLTKQQSYKKFSMKDNKTDNLDNNQIFQFNKISRSSPKKQQHLYPKNVQTNELRNSDSHFLDRNSFEYTKNTFLEEKRKSKLININSILQNLSNISYQKDDDTLSEQNEISKSNEIEIEIFEDLDVENLIIKELIEENIITNRDNYYIINKDDVLRMIYLLNQLIPKFNEISKKNDEKNKENNQINENLNEEYIQIYDEISKEKNKTIQLEEELNILMGLKKEDENKNKKNHDCMLKYKNQIEKINDYVQNSINEYKKI